MKFKYNNKTYTGSRQEIIESLKHDLENNKEFWFGYNPSEILFFLGEERFKITIHSNYNADDIKISMIQAALGKVPKNYFTFNHKTYYGSKEVILEKIEKI